MLGSFKVISELAREIARKDGEIEILRERAAEQDRLVRELVSNYIFYSVNILSTVCCP